MSDIAVGNTCNIQALPYLDNTIVKKYIHFMVCTKVLCYLINTKLSFYLVLLSNNRRLHLLNDI